MLQAKDRYYNLIINSLKYLKHTNSSLICEIISKNYNITWYNVRAIA